MRRALLLCAALLAPVALLAQEPARSGAPPTAGAGKAAPANPVFLPLPEPTLEGFKKAEPGIDPKVWQLFDAADAEMIRAKQARLPRRIDRVIKTVLAAKPGESRLTQNSNDLKVLENGLLVSVISNAEGVTDAAIVSVGMMGLLPVYSRAHITVQSAYVIEGTLTRYLAELPRFDLKPGALAPGGTFGWELTTRGTAYNRTVGVFTSSPKTTEDRAPSRGDCTVGERIPAKEIFPEFTGSALKISCAQSESGVQVTGSLIYLEDYAWFMIQKESATGITAEYKITGVLW